MAKATATTTAEADSSAALRNDKQKGERLEEGALRNDKQRVSD
jgi:hypothetical protein